MKIRKQNWQIQSNCCGNCLNRFLSQEISQIQHHAFEYAVMYSSIALKLSIFYDKLFGLFNIYAQNLIQIDHWIIAIQYNQSTRSKYRFATNWKNKINKTKWKLDKIGQKTNETKSKNHAINQIHTTIIQSWCNMSTKYQLSLLLQLSKPTVIQQLVLFYGLQFMSQA